MIAYENGIRCGPCPQEACSHARENLQDQWHQQQLIYNLEHGHGVLEFWWKGFMEEMGLEDGPGPLGAPLDSTWEKRVVILRMLNWVLWWWVVANM